MLGFLGFIAKESLMQLAIECSIMEKERSRERIKEQTQSKEAVSYKKKITQNVCGKCGQKNESDAAFCEECGNSLLSNHCTKCNAELIPGADVCEQCGDILILVKCSFCGSDKDEDDNFCPECGNPASGISCNNCQTLNHANFCSNCNNPLTEIAELELEKAKKDPLYQETVQLMDDIAELQKELESVESGIKESEAQKEEVRIQESNETDFTNDRSIFEDMAAYTKANPEKKKESGKPVVKVEKKPKRVFDTTSHDKLLAERDKRAQAIQEKMKALQEKLDEMAAMEFPSPQEARTYHSARKPPIENLVWNCKFNDSLHPDPRNCGQPQHGGKWIIEEGHIQWRTHHGEC